MDKKRFTFSLHFTSLHFFHFTTKSKRVSWHNENPPAPSGRIFSEETHSASLLPNSTIFVIFHWMCFHSADEKKMKRVWEFLIMKYTFNRVHFNFYDIAAVWKQKEKAFDFCVLSFKRACTQALTIGRITRRMGAHLTAFVANETPP